MFYEYTLTIPAATKKEEPVEVTALVEPGILTYTEVAFPYGCHQLAHVAIFEGDFQIAPRNRESDIAADGYVVPIYPNYPLRRGENVLTLKGWGSLTHYSHEIKVRLTVLPKEEAEPLTPLKDFVKAFKKLMGVD